MGNRWPCAPDLFTCKSCGNSYTYSLAYKIYGLKWDLCVECIKLIKKLDELKKEKQCGDT